MMDQVRTDPSPFRLFGTIERVPTETLAEVRGILTTLVGITALTATRRRLQP